VAIDLAIGLAIAKATGLPRKEGSLLGRGGRTIDGWGVLHFLQSLDEEVGDYCDLSGWGYGICDDCGRVDSFYLPVNLYVTLLWTLTIAVCLIRLSPLWRTGSSGA
jgi:hypothetical protein